MREFSSTFKAISTKNKLMYLDDNRILMNVIERLVETNKVTEKELIDILNKVVKDSPISCYNTRI